VSNVSDAKDQNRRGFLRKLFGLTAAAGVAGLLLDRSVGKTLLPPVQATGTPLTLDDNAGTGVGTTQLSSSGNAAFLSTNTSNGAGLQGTSTVGTGVFGTTATGTGVQGTASSTSGVALAGFASDPGAIPIVAQGSGSGQSANLQEWRGGSGTLSVVDANGNLGLGTASPGRRMQATANTFPGFRLTDPTNRSNNFWEFIWNENASNDFGFAFSYFDGSTNQAGLLVQSNVSGTRAEFQSTSGATLLNIQNGGHVGLGLNAPAHLIHLNGGAYCDGTGSWIAGSSVRWKENITPLAGGVDTLKQLHPVAYNRKETPGKKTMGFIAEEVGKVLPTVVDWDKAEPGYAEGYDHLAILALAV
jgi:hypothetical protein